MARTRRSVLIGADVEDILNNHFKEIAVAIPESMDLIERYSMLLARQEDAQRDAIVDEFRGRLLGLLRTRFTVVTADERRHAEVA